MVARALPETKIRAIGRWHEARVTDARERLVSEAFVLFYDYGIRAVGINLVIARSGVAKATFYRQFRSKDELIVAYLDRRHEAWLAWLTESVAARATKPGERLIVIFDCLAELFKDPDFRGCPVINAVAEVGRDNPEMLERARTYKADLHNYVVDLAMQADLGRPNELADQWVLLIDGALVVAQRSESSTPARSAKRMAKALLDTW
jgi:AcrR family transcriptional regulator